MDLAYWVSIGSDIAIGASAAVAAYLAVKGVNAWRSELKGRSEYQLAKDVLRAVYKTREGFKIVRHPAIFGYEYPEEMRDHFGHLKREHNFEGTAHVYQERFNHLNEAFKALEDLHLDAQVEWGPEFHDTIVKLRQCRSELMVTLQMKLDRMKEENDRDPVDTEALKKEHDVIYDANSEKHPNPFNDKIDGAIAEFENWLRPKVSRDTE